MRKIIIKRGEKMDKSLLLLAETAQQSDDPGVLFVCLMGVGVVFIGLICIIGLVELMTWVCNKFVKEKPAKAEPALAETKSVIPYRQELIAAVCAACAEENGTDISAIRVLSFKEIK